jgi:hypothetical protein
MRAAATVLALALGASGCDSGSPASPTFQSTPGEAETGVEAGPGEAGFAVCPDVDASFGSIYTQILSTPSCGTNNPLTCHSPSGSVSAGNLLDLSLDAGAVAVFAELLGADGGGYRSTNEDHPDVFVPRVVPFDAGASMLYLKLTITSSNDPQYGSGMPLTAPGSVCPATLAAVAAWINAGAPFAPPDGGATPDASTGADAGPGVDATLD